MEALTESFIKGGINSMENRPIEELQETIKEYLTFEYQRKGILFVAAAIGDDKQNIERIYGDSFMDISDLKQLPTKLTAVVKRHIRV